MSCSETNVGCYGEDEQSMGVLYTLEDRPSFPLQAKALGELVEVVGLDDAQSSLRRGGVARVCKGGKE